MKTALLAGASALALIATSACTTPSGTAALDDESVSEETPTAETETPEVVETEDWRVLTAEWDGPYGGVPPFDEIEVSMFQPALEAAMESARRQIGALTRQRSAPTFENTILRLEEGGAGS